MKTLKYNQLIIYYFSGTGNARNAAKWIINVAKVKGMETRLINIDQAGKIDTPTLNDKTLIGFCAPTHGFNLPPIVLKFIWKFPGSYNSKVFILNTRAGMKLYKLFLPGLSGIAQIFPAFILWLKGYKIVGMQPLDLPSNWTILHPGLRKRVIDSIYKRCNGIVNDFVEQLLEGRRKYKALLSLPIDIALFPIAIAYYLIGRFFLAKTLIATDSCNKCKACITQCPVRAIQTVNKRPFWTYRCESCMRCINLCPQRAIETAHGYASLILLASSLLISPLLLFAAKSLGVLDVIYHSALTEKIWLLIDSFFFLVFVFITYGLLHFLMRFKWINRLIAYTSLSKYRFWRRYKAPNY